MTFRHDEPHAASAAAESATLPLADGDIYVRQDGPRDAPALLLIHGSAASTRSFDVQAATPLRRWPSNAPVR
jgi:pimeloyl-ACP methyl ester carboxylesterase